MGDLGYQGAKACRECFDIVRDELIAEAERAAEVERNAHAMTVVRSRHVGRHRTVKVLGDLQSTGEHRTPGNAEFELRMAAAELDANAIIGFHCTSETLDEPSFSGRGVHYYRNYRAFGTAVVIEPQHTDGDRQHREERRHRSVAECLELLGLPPTASDSDIRQAYRRLVAQYHPDKVAHLGPDLRQLAERKTRAIIKAYDDLRRARRAT